MYNQIVIIGILVSLLFTEITNLSAGVIIPGYLALCLSSPSRVVYTIALSIFTSLIVKFLSRYVILYGRRRFAMMIVIAFILDLISPIKTNAIGVLVPGILAREIDRQGLADTMVAVFITTSLMALIMFIMGYPVFG